MVEKSNNMPSDLEDKKMIDIHFLSNAIHMPCNFFDENFNVIDCNQEAIKTFNLSSKEEYINCFNSLSPIYQQDGSLSTEKSCEMLRIAFKDGKCVFEWMHQLLDGEPFPSEITLINVQWKNSSIVVGYIRDLREIIKAKQADERIRIMLDSMPMCCNFWNENLDNIDCNQEAVALFNLSCKQDYLDRFFELSPKYQPDGSLSKEKIHAMVTKAFVDGKCTFKWMHQLLNDEPIPTEILLVRVNRQNFNVVVGYTHDLREVIKAKEADDRMRAMFESMPICCNFWEGNFNNIDCNQETVTLFNLSSKQDYLDRFFELSPEYQPDGSLSIEKSKKMMNKALETGKCEFEWMHQLLDGELIPAKITLIRIMYNGKDVVLGYTQDLREIRKTVELLNNMEQLANIDFLTGLYNRRYCIQILSELLEKKKKFSVCFIDINNLKKVNDCSGHQSGDDYIQLVVKELTKDLRDNDILCRIGGDEFVLIFIGLNENESEYKLELINKSIINHSKEYSYSISYGIVHTNSITTNTVESILQEADEKMYLFKQKKIYRSLLLRG